MTKIDALKLVKNYIDGWKQNNLQLILSCLSENCTIIESHGPTYRCRQDIERWFHLWLEAGSSISKWDIRSFAFCENEQTAFCEWDFACQSHGTEYPFSGMSVFRFSDRKISFIHEYRMIRSAFVWDGKKLVSE